MKCLYLVAFIFVLFSCKSAKNDAHKTFNEHTEEPSMDVIFNDRNDWFMYSSENFLIGGKSYVSEFYKQIYLYVDPYDNNYSINLFGIEKYDIFEEIIIRGNNLDKVDFSPLFGLTQLERLYIYYGISEEQLYSDEYYLTKIPNLKEIKNLKSFYISNISTSLEDMVNNLPNTLDSLIISGGKLENINELVRLNNLKRLGLPYGNYNIHDLEGLDNLEYLGIGTLREIDFYGIEYLPSLNSLDIYNVEDNKEFKYINIERLGSLQGLNRLDLDVKNEDIDFIKNMLSLEVLIIRNLGNIMTFDIELLNKIENLQLLMLTNFSIYNVELLNDFNYLSYVSFPNCIFIPEGSEKNINRYLVESDH
jgi:hypothetical protein